jgi:hypothetical protein
MAFGDLGRRATEWWSSLAREQRVSVVVLGLCGVGAVVFSWMQLARQLGQPFSISRTAWERTDQFLSAQEKEAQELEAMRFKDTDGDGLSDYSEQYHYGTSPYIIDSDSDSVPDSLELAQGEDPNCPRGRVCRNAATETVAATSSFTPESFVSPLTPLLAGLISAGAETETASEGVQSPGAPGTLSPEQVRQFFVSQGVATIEELRTISDVEILEIYATAYRTAHQQLSNGSTSSPRTSPTAPIDDDL